MPLLLLGLIVLALVVRWAFARITDLERSVRRLNARIEQIAFHATSEALPIVAPPIESIPSVPISGPSSPIPAPPSPVPRPPFPVPDPSSPVPGPSSPVRVQEHESLETTIGSRWLLYVGVFAIVVGVGYFEKLAFDNEWIGETARVIQGGALGLILLYVGHRFIRAGDIFYGQMICGGAAAILYVSAYASFNFYHLIGRPEAFFLMAVITATAALLADHHRSQGLAILAVGGGFITPFLLPSTTDAEIALFGYDAFLVAATMALARRRDWPLLNLVSYALTTLTVIVWAAGFFTPAKYLTTELFLTLFCGMFLYILWQARQHEVRLRVLSWPLWSAPIAYYGASLVILAMHATAALVWLVALGLVAAVTLVEAPPLAGLVLWILTMWPLLMWTSAHGSDEWLVPGLSAIAGVYLPTLIAHLRSTSASRPPTPAQLALLHLNPLGAFAGMYLLINPVNIDAPAPVAASLALAQFAIAWVLWRHRRDQARHFAAVGSALLAIAIALEFGGAWITIGWAAEGAAVIALGLSEDRDWMRACGALLFALATLRTLRLLVTDATIADLVLLNRRAACALVVVGLLYLVAWLHHRRRAAVDYSFDIAAALVTAKLVLFGLLTSEIYSYWATHEGSDVARDMTLSIAWAVYATVLVVIGLRRNYAPLRYVAFIVFALTILKVFLVDLAHLNRIYRVFSVIALGITLLLTSYLYTRFKGQTEKT
jgi:uncharacterized membrane protein